MTMKRPLGKQAKISKVFRGESTTRELSENIDNQEKEISVEHMGNIKKCYYLVLCNRVYTKHI